MPKKVNKKPQEVYPRLEPSKEVLDAQGDASDLKIFVDTLKGLVNSSLGYNELINKMIKQHIFARRESFLYGVAVGLLFGLFMLVLNYFLTLYYGYV